MWQKESSCMGGGRVRKIRYVGQTTSQSGCGSCRGGSLVRYVMYKDIQYPNGGSDTFRMNEIKEVTDEKAVFLLSLENMFVEVV